MATCDSSIEDYNERSSEAENFPKQAETSTSASNESSTIENITQVLQEVG